MKKLILILMLGIFLISLASAEIQTLGTFKQRECINFIQTCDNCTYNNISSVLYPDSSIALSNVVMTRDDTYYNYTFCDASILGHYIVNGYGDLDGEKTIWSYDFEVTADGIERSVFPIQFSIILFAFVMIFFGLIKERYRMFKHVGSILLMIMGVLTLYPGYGFINWETLIGKALGFIFIGLGAYFFIEGSFSRKEQDDTYDQETEKEEGGGNY